VFTRVLLLQSVLVYAEWLQLGVLHSIVSFAIRKATKSDGEGVLHCLRSAFAQFERSYTKDAFADTVLTAETLAVRLKSMSLFVAVNEQDEVVGTIGCASLGRGEGHLRGMAVLPEWQGTGIAEQLLERAESELRVLGCARVTLDTTEPLKRAMRFYERHGYRPTGRVTSFFGMPLFEYAKEL
jgi:GNAT superfamily N-acetyltransferase